MQHGADDQILQSLPRRVRGLVRALLLLQRAVRVRVATRGFGNFGGDDIVRVRGSMHASVTREYDQNVRVRIPSLLILDHVEVRDDPPQHVALSKVREQLVQLQFDTGAPTDLQLVDSRSAAALLYNLHQ